MLSHNSLFILHPSDEIPSTRHSNSSKTFYKHGVPKFGGKDKLSCALVFWYTTRTELFDALSGKKMNKCNDESYKQKFSESDRILHKYITSDD